MSLRLRDVLFEQLGELRYEPVDKRIRAALRGAPVLDSRRPLLVWEPRRVVPSYAVPEADVSATVSPSSPARVAESRRIEIEGRPVLDPSIPFAVHTAPGFAADLELDGSVLPGAAFRCADPALDGYLIIDFGACDTWYEEDERNLGHPRDPFHRIEIVHSSRHVQIESDGVLLAESRSPYLLYESNGRRTRYAIAWPSSTSGWT